jgi:glycerol dehydrogenase
MDTAKSVANPAGLPLVIVPTIASTDAPTSALAVVYAEEGGFLEYRFFGRNPDAVIVTRPSSPGRRCGSWWPASGTA